MTCYSFSSNYFSCHLLCFAIIYFIIEVFFYVFICCIFCLNYKMTNFAKVAGKSVEGANVLGYIEQYAKSGVRVNEAEMIRTGAINPFDYDLPQDDTKVNAIRLHTPGYYVLVLPKFRYEEEERANLQQYVY